MIDLIHNLRRDANAQFEAAGSSVRPPFLRRAESDDFLLCSDAPRRLHNPEHAAGLFHEAGRILSEKDGLWFFDVPIADYELLDASLSTAIPERPPEEKYLGIWALCRTLREHPSPVERQHLWAVRRTIKAIEAGGAQVLSLAESMPPRLAELLRKKETLPCLAGKLLAQWLNEIMRKEMV